MFQESTLIIGNGFDLDLGLKTTFSHFAESEFWPVTNQIRFRSQLASFLDQHRQVDKWFDIEKLLANFAAPQNDAQEDAKAYLFGTHSADYQFFIELQNKLCEYICQQENTELNKSSLAFALLELVSGYSTVDNIFSFNYTNINKYCENNNLRQITYRHVHGSCANNDAILGISDDNPVREKCEYLYKTSSPYYQSSNVRYALQRSSLVIFFGHSLGPQDYHYFENLFREQSATNMQEAQRKTLLFITKDESSRMDIVRQLRKMNGNRMNYLYDCNELRFFKTAEQKADNIISNIRGMLDAIEEYRARKAAAKWVELHANGQI